ncbi:MAG: DsrE family protein [Deferribacterales bacterium]
MADKVVIVHLSSNDILKAGKALRFAGAALSHTDTVILMLTAQGVSVADKTKEPFMIPTRPENNLDCIRQFIKDGGRVFVGMDCLKALGTSASDIIAGCEQAEPSFVFNLLLSDQAVIMSW